MQRLEIGWNNFFDFFWKQVSLENFQGQQTFIAWAVCFPITDHVIFSRELFFTHLKFIPSYTLNYWNIWKWGFSRVLSHGLKWGN